MQIVDSGPDTADRYTVEIDGHCWGFDADPFHPLGFGQYCGELGGGVSPEWLALQTPIALESLPEKAQQFVRSLLKDMKEGSN